MNSRERVLAAYRREKVDRLPIYYSGQKAVDESLLKHFGLTSQDELLQKLGCDIVNVVPDYVGPTGFPAWTNTNSPKLLDAMRQGDYDALAEYHFPEAWWYDGKTVVSKIREARKFNYAVALGDEALGSILTMTGVWFGVEHLLTLMFDKPKFVHSLFEKVCDFAYGMTEDMLAHGGSEADFFWFGDDAGTQLSLMVSPEVWKTYLAPQYKRLITLADRHNLPTIIHSCGAVREIIPDMIDVGITVLHPVQTAAEGMIPEELAGEFGNDMMFFGGIDTQHLLPNGTAEDIREFIDRLRRTLGKNNGYIAAPSQLLDIDIPIANIITMYEYLNTV